ncbi:MAG: hypothetical protein R3D26_01610 [Cyanobacteriota/Melainabacteria group bacterium]
MIFSCGCPDVKMAQPFLLDDVSGTDWLFLTTIEEVGIIYGTVGMLFLLAGNLFGDGW